MSVTGAIELIRFHCPHCGKTMRAPAKKAGRKGPCARCGNRIEIPSADAVDSSTAEADLSGNSIEEAELIDGFALPMPERPVETLEELKEFAETRTDVTAKRLRTPLWLWVLHLSLPITTAVILLNLYHSRGRDDENVPMRIVTTGPAQEAAPAGIER